LSWRSTTLSSKRNAYQRFRSVRQKTRNCIRRVESEDGLCTDSSYLSITTCWFWSIVVIPCLHVVVNT
jgi:hypothetical protein